jgi:hypothetical protein
MPESHAWERQREVWFKTTRRRSHRALRSLCSGIHCGPTVRLTSHSHAAIAGVAAPTFAAGYLTTTKTSPVMRIATGFDQASFCAGPVRFGFTPRTR